MKALIERNLRTAFGALVAVGILALPQTTQAQTRIAPNSPFGVKILARSGGGGFETTSLGAWTFQRLRIWLKASDAPVLSGSVGVPPAIKAKKLGIDTSIPVY